MKKNSFSLLTPELLFVINQIKNHNGKSMIVGGAVRDILFSGKISDDIDISTNLLPHIIHQIFLNHLNIFSINTVGIEYGSIMLESKITGKKYEITTIREDVICTGRYAKVKFGSDFYLDSIRRDFTINAIYMDENGRIYDYHDGLKDLESGTVKFIGDPEKRIREDYLRILRFFRFSARFAKEIDQTAVLVIKYLSAGLKNISKERITSELIKIVQSDNKKVMVLKAMSDCGVISEIFDKDIKFDYNYIFKTLEIDQSANIAISLLSIHDSAVKNKLSLTRSESRLLQKIDKYKDYILSEKTNFHSIAKIWLIEKDIQIIKMFKCVDLRLIDDVTHIPDLPFDGNKLISMGIFGKNIARFLDASLDVWIGSNFQASEREIIESSVKKITDLG